MNEYQKKVIASLSKEKQDFINKQLTVFTDSMMKGNMFMACDGKCMCGGDVIKYEIEDGNDGSKAVTGCPYCHRSFCD